MVAAVPQVKAFRRYAKQQILPIDITSTIEYRMAKWFEANLNLGLALAKSSNFAQAAPVLRNAVQLKPTTGGEQALSKAWFALGQVLDGVTVIGGERTHGRIILCAILSLPTTGSWL